MSDTTTVNLDRFGFTPTEGRVYAALLKTGATTGYVVAKATGVARANVYQALDGLVRRGAVRRSATIPAQYAALPPAALVSEIQRNFRRDLAELEASLKALPQAGNGGTPAGLEAIAAAEALDERAAACADAARGELQAVTGPWAPALNDALERAAGRGVTVRAIALGEPGPAVAVPRPVPEGELLAYWGGFPIAVAGDRGRAVAGVVMADGTASGIVTEFAGVVPFIRHLLRREVAGPA